jgi:orotidine-5'-phosphate decarboxylase
MNISGKEMLLAAQAANHSLIGAGLDECLYNPKLIDGVADQVCMYKIDPAAYAPHGHVGLSELRDNISHIRHYAPNIPIIFDKKYDGSARANEFYAKEAFDFLKVDGVTVGPYNGMDTFEPFLERKDKLIFVVCKTSNTGSEEFQDELVSMPGTAHRIPLYQKMAHRVATEWNKNGNCGVVVGATFPRALALVRRAVGDDITILSPGGGDYQGADVVTAFHSGKNSLGTGIVIHFSRQFENAASPRDEATRLRHLINQQG